jgi:ceramide glucosyltransferase
MFAELVPFLIVTPPLAYSLLSLWCTCAFFRGAVVTAADRLPVTLLKPVKGLDAESYKNFASFCRQEYAEFQLIFVVARDDDPAIPVIRQLLDDFSAVDIELVVDGTLHGPNYKVGNLINALPRAKHDLLVITDADVRVSPGYLSAVAAAFADPTVGLVTSLYRSSGVQGWATAIEGLGFSAEMIPNVLVAHRLEGLSFALGASMAVRREVLAAIGGMEALVDFLADDYQLGHKVHRAGWRLVLSCHFVECVMTRESLLDVLLRQLRWARTMRVSRPGGYLASGVTLAFPAALLAILAGGGGAVGWGAAALLYGVRAAVMTALSRIYVRDGLLPGYLWLLPLRDALASACWGLAFLGRRVVWRGHQYTIVPGGKLEEINES